MKFAERKAQHVALFSQRAEACRTRRRASSGIARKCVKQTSGSSVSIVAIRPAPKPSPDKDRIRQRYRPRQAGDVVARPPRSRKRIAEAP